MENTTGKKKTALKSEKKKESKITPLQKKLLNGPVMSDPQWKEYLEVNPRAQKWKI